VAPSDQPPAAGEDAGEVLARQKFHCPACGADAHWNPAKQALICPFCGTESAVELAERTADTVIVEHDLIASLQKLPESARGWQAEKTSVRCQSCRAISVFDADKVGQRCEFCGSAQLVPYEQTADLFRPESLLPMKISEPDARDRIRNWYRRQWLAPNALAKKALTDTARGVYLPYWTFDARAHATWTADSGTYYYTREGGKQVRKVRWTPAAGEVSHVFDDELVAGSTGVNPKLLSKIEPFPTGSVVPYDPGYLAGWVVERYQVDLQQAAARSRQQMDATLRRMCASEVPGDTHRNLVVRSTYADERFKHVLVPVWLLTYNYGAAAYQVLVNGVTGSIAGTHPWSWVKITLLILLALIALYVFASLQN
jgi:hypothetical protein